MIFDVAGNPIAAIANGTAQVVSSQPLTSCESDDEEAKEAMQCEEQGGWGSDDGGVLPLIPSLPPPKKSLSNAANAPPADEYRTWVEAVSYQVGNAAHEIRNALRYWASLVTTDSSSEASQRLLERFRKADNTSGKLEATMRALVGRVRNARNVSKPLERLLPQASRLLAQIRTDLDSLGGDTEGVAEQRGVINSLLARKDRYLAAITAAHSGGDRPPTRPSGLADGAPLPLPPPGVRVDFFSWGQAEEALLSKAGAVVASAEVIIGVARLACNAAHECQNLCVAPRGAAGTKAHATLKQLDNLAGQCENRARAIMVLAHRWHTTQRARPAEAIVKQANALQAAVSTGEGLALAAASCGEGGSQVPGAKLASVLARLGRLASVLATRRSAKPQARPAARCANCGYAVTGLAPQHCCKGCKKSPGQHGPKCRKELFVADGEIAKP